jgi:hypothetical protein
MTSRHDPEQVLVVVDDGRPAPISGISQAHKILPDELVEVLDVVQFQQFRHFSRYGIVFLICVFRAERII